MTRPQYFDLPAGHFGCGVRFRPGRARALLGVPACLLTDRSIPLADLGRRPRRSESANGLHRLIDWVVERRGDVRVEDLARHSGLSARQLRRRFLEETGVGPKQFCRILRFRRATSELAGWRGDWAGLAADCGYFDQSHLIREFREFAGGRPGEVMADFSNRLRPAPG
jgi:transcriptional regulator GlxA family with amidase domain